MRFVRETWQKRMAGRPYPDSVRRGLGLISVVLALAAPLAGCRTTDPSVDGDNTGDQAADCRAKLDASAAVVRTDHRWTDQQVPGIGNYVDIHWQARALGNPCSRVPGPTDWQYQGLVQLATPDVEPLAKSRDWQPSGAPPAWAGLAALIPAGTTWSRAADVYLDHNHALLFFTLTDS
jgi:hypothetical protein